MLLKQAHPLIIEVFLKLFINLFFNITTLLEELLCDSVLRFYEALSCFWFWLLKVSVGGLDVIFGTTVRSIVFEDIQSVELWVFDASGPLLYLSLWVLLLQSLTDLSSWRVDRGIKDLIEIDCELFMMVFWEPGVILDLGHLTL
jgi:hypothetical protein